MTLSRLAEIRQILARSYGPRHSSTAEHDMCRVAQILLDEAVEQFGPRLSGAVVREGVTFHGGMPHIHYPMGLVAIKLSDNACGYWPTFIYECAHETVHLLDAQVGVRYAKVIEEAVASEFADSCVAAVDPSYAAALERHEAEARLDPNRAAYLDKYETARTSLRSLGANWPEVVRSIRTSGTPFHQVVAPVIRQHVPSISDAAAAHLSDFLK